MAELKEIKKVFASYKERINRLKEIEEKIEKMDLEEAGDREEEIREKLTDPTKIDEVEEEYHTLQHISQARRYEQKADRYLNNVGKEQEEQGRELLEGSEAGIGEDELKQIEERTDTAMHKYGMSRRFYKSAGERYKKGGRDKEKGLKDKARAATAGILRCKILLGRAALGNGEKSFNEKDFDGSMSSAERAKELFTESADLSEDIDNNSIADDVQAGLLDSNALIDRSNRGSEISDFLGELQDKCSDIEETLTRVEREGKEDERRLLEKLNRASSNVERVREELESSLSFAADNDFDGWKETLEDFKAELKGFTERIEALTTKETEESEEQKTETSGSGASTTYVESLFVTWQQSKDEFGRFVQRGVIGEGGGGIVYLAYDPRLEILDAIKLLPVKLRKSPKARASLLREARLAAQVAHPNIVTVKDITLGDDEVPSSIIMEYVDGPDLKYMIDEEGPFSLKRVKRYLKQICKALYYAHEEKEVVHSDIKPSNILIGYDDRVVITDFGLARNLSNTISMKSDDRQVMDGYTPTYSPPEQHVGEELSPASDVYALGITVYEMIVGEPPFTCGNLTYQHRKKEPKPPTKLNANLPDQVDRVLMKCLAKEPGERYSNTMQLWDDFKQIDSQVDIEGESSA
ncbi:protein kinase [Candidatus Bipolaricaulota bacterium]|nr:protein kinase [Candidatus Bipolaricaulota bacterium]